MKKTAKIYIQKGLTYNTRMEQDIEVYVLQIDYKNRPNCQYLFIDEIPEREIIGEYNILLGKPIFNQIINRLYYLPSVNDHINNYIAHIDSAMAHTLIKMFEDINIKDNQLNDPGHLNEDELKQLVKTYNYYKQLQKEGFVKGINDYKFNSNLTIDVDTALMKNSGLIVYNSDYTYKSILLEL